MSQIITLYRPQKVGELQDRVFVYHAQVSTLLLKRCAGFWSLVSVPACILWWFCPSHTDGPLVHKKQRHKARALSRMNEALPIHLGPGQCRAKKQRATQQTIALRLWFPSTSMENINSTQEGEPPHSEGGRVWSRIVEARWAASGRPWKPVHRAPGSKTKPKRSNKT